MKAERKEDGLKDCEREKKGNIFVKDKKSRKVFFLNIWIYMCEWEIEIDRDMKSKT